MRKVHLVTQVIEKRIANVDHVLEGVPSERRLAEELGLSRTTVRTAFQSLVKQGVLVRTGNGRLHVDKRGVNAAKKVVGFVTPAGLSADYQMWYQSVTGALEGSPVALRQLNYVHIDDSAITDAISSFDALFFIGLPDNVPAWLAQRMKESNCRVVILDRDESAAGLPSVLAFPRDAERALFEHLVSLGHRRIDCLVTQAGTERRIEAWQSFIDEHHLSGQLRSRLVQQPIGSAHALVQETLREGRPLASALFCTTGPAAIGAMRALHEAGLEVGRDVSVCAVNSEGLGPYLLKSLTAVESPSRVPLVRQALDWMLGDEQWEGPLLIRPERSRLFIGESTGSAPESSAVLPRVG